MTRPNVEAIVIGASAGGVGALLKLLPGLPARFKPPVIVVLHMPPHHESRLGAILQHRTHLPVREVRDKEPIEGSTIYVAVPDHHLSIEDDFSFSLSGEEPVCFARPSIDVLMNSAAQAYGAGLAGVLLSGANVDGARGLAYIGELGGLTIVQDPSEAEVPTMPQAAIDLRNPDHVLPLAGIHDLLLNLGGQP